MNCTYLYSYCWHLFPIVSFTQFKIALSKFQTRIVNKKKVRQFRRTLLLFLFMACDVRLRRHAAVVLFAVVLFVAVAAAVVNCLHYVYRY